MRRGSVTSRLCAAAHFPFVSVIKDSPFPCGRPLAATLGCSPCPCPWESATLRPQPPPGTREGRGYTPIVDAPPARNPAARVRKEVDGGVRQADGQDSLREADGVLQAH